MTDTSSTYITELEFRAYIGDDSTLETAAVTTAIRAACRKIDTHCRRWFNQRDLVRYFSPSTSEPWLLPVTDIATTDDLVVELLSGNTYGGALTFDADFLCDPVNQERDGIYPFPYTELRRLSGYWPLRTTPQRRDSVRVTATFGWPDAVPDDVKQATKIVAAQLWKLGSAPFGVAGFNEFGSVRVRDVPAASEILLPYCRGGGVGIA